VDDLFTKLSAVAQHKEPQNNSVESLKKWSVENFPEWNGVLKETDVDDLRGIWAPKGQIDNLILNLSQNKIGNALVVSRNLIFDRTLCADINSVLLSARTKKRGTSSCRSTTLLSFFAPAQLFPYVLSWYSSKFPLLFCRIMFSTERSPSPWPWASVFSSVCLRSGSRQIAPMSFMSWFLLTVRSSVETSSISRMTKAW